MNIHDLTVENLSYILGTYKRVCGHSKPIDLMLFMPVQAALENMKASRGQEYRIGSQWDSQSKIWFEVDGSDSLSVRFSVNFDPKDRQDERHDQAERAREEFGRLMAGYVLAAPSKVQGTSFEDACLLLDKANIPLQTNYTLANRDGFFRNSNIVVGQKYQHQIPSLLKDAHRIATGYCCSAQYTPSAALLKNMSGKVTLENGNLVERVEISFRPTSS